MKKLCITFLSVLLSIVLYAQPKGSVTKAKAFLDKGDLPSAKTEIDNAIAGETAKLQAKGKEVKIKPDMAYHKGIIYAAIAMSDDEKVQALAPDALKEAIDAFNLILTTEKETNTYYTFAQMEKDKLFGFLLNKSVDFYNQEDRLPAIEYAEKALMVNPKDTTSMQIVVLSAYNEGMETSDEAIKPVLKNKVIENASKLIEIGFKKPYLYRMIANYDRIKANELLSDGKKDEARPLFDNAMKILQEGQKANPQDKDIATDLINIYILTEQTEQAIASISDAIRLSPNDKILYYNRGLLYSRLGNEEDALKDYHKAIELDPKYNDAYYSIGAMYYNKAVEVGKKINSLDIDGKTGQYKDKKAAAELEEQYKSYLEKSLPSFEKSYEIEPSNQETIELLAYIYQKLGKKAEYEKMSKLIKE